MQALDVYCKHRMNTPRILISVRLPVALNERLNKHVQDEGMTKEGVVRKALEAYLPTTVRRQCGVKP